MIKRLFRDKKYSSKTIFTNITSDSI